MKAVVQIVAISKFELFGVVAKVMEDGGSVGLS